jgi:hypothetical protein
MDPGLLPTLPPLTPGPHQHAGSKQQDGTRLGDLRPRYCSQRGSRCVARNGTGGHRNRLALGEGVRPHRGGLNVRGDLIAGLRQAAWTNATGRHGHIRSTGDYEVVGGQLKVFPASFQPAVFLLYRRLRQM